MFFPFLFTFLGFLDFYDLGDNYSSLRAVSPIIDIRANTGSLAIILFIFSVVISIIVIPYAVF